MDVCVSDFKLYPMFQRIPYMPPRDIVQHGEDQKPSEYQAGCNAAACRHQGCRKRASMSAHRSSKVQKALVQENGCHAATHDSHEPEQCQQLDTHGTVLLLAVRILWGRAARTCSTCAAPMFPSGSPLV